MSKIDMRTARQATTTCRTATHEDFDFSFNPKIPKAKILDLSTAGFVGRIEKILLVGQTSVGKSHIAQALGQRASLRGFKVLYTSAHAIFCT